MMSEMSKLSKAQKYALVALFEAEQENSTAEFQHCGNFVFCLQSAWDGGTIRDRTMQVLVDRGMVQHYPQLYHHWLFTSIGREIAYGLYLDGKASS